MRIEKTIVINDEPWVPTSTGKRTATLVYKGPKYLYLEYNALTNKIEVVAHISEATQDMEVALEKLTPIEGREIVEINAEEKTILASYFWNVYSLSVENYLEELENGDTYSFEYSIEPHLGEIFDFNKMEWDTKLNDFKEYLFLVHPVSDQEIVDSIDLILEKISDSLATNTGLSEEQKTELATYIQELTQFKNNVGLGVENWKMKFPVCNIPY